MTFNLLANTLAMILYNTLYKAIEHKYFLIVSGVLHLGIKVNKVPFRLAGNPFSFHPYDTSLKNILTHNR